MFTPFSIHREATAIQVPENSRLITTQTGSVIAIEMKARQKIMAEINQPGRN
jgi:hypothetical protein